MFIPNIISIKPIERQYSTGEEPVLVLCSDMNSYICKYMRSSVSSYKLTCELVGGLMAKAWGIHTPDIAFVRIKPEHWAGVRTTHSVSAPTLGGILEYYEASLQRSLDKQKELLDALPQAWNVQKDVLAEKLRQLFDKNWIAGVWENFVENLKENSYGKS